MKMRPEIKKSSLVLAAGLILASLVFYVFVTLMDLPKREAWIETFIQSTHMEVVQAAERHKEYVAAPDAVNIENDILKPLTETRKRLDAVYSGTDLESREIISGLDDIQLPLKISLIELEKAEDAIKAKTSVDFSRALHSLDAISKILTDSAEFRMSVIRYISWFLVGCLFSLAVGLAIYEYKITRLEQINLTKAQSLLDAEVRRVEKLSGFIEAISSGNYSIDLTAGEQDELNTKLGVMRDKLRKNADDDQQRNWASTGLAQAGEILRANTSAQVLYDTIIKFVVKYTQSNQGGLFIINEDEREKQLELAACYAYERKKFLTRKIDIGQGIIGQCFLEKERIHLTRIPDDYVNITSGLGGANPSSLLLMPLKTNDEVFGVLELASFKAYADFQIDWIERLAENIASTIASVRTNESTRLLLERTQQQAEEMKAQEEEMRQNMEELSATQEEMGRKEREYISRINELEAQLSVEVR